MQKKSGEENFERIHMTTIIFWWENFLGGMYVLGNENIHG
jgi:hypothetical protein